MPISEETKPVLETNWLSIMLIWAALLFMNGVYLVLVILLSGTWLENGESILPLGSVRVVLFSLAIATIIAAHYLKKAWTIPESTVLSGSQTTRTEHPAVNKYRFLVIILSTMLGSIGLYGFVLFLLTSNTAGAFQLMAVSVASMIYYRPTKVELLDMLIKMEAGEDGEATIDDTEDEKLGELFECLRCKEKDSVEGAFLRPHHDRVRLDIDGAIAPRRKDYNHPSDPWIATLCRQCGFFSGEIRIKDVNQTIDRYGSPEFKASIGQEMPGDSNASNRSDMTAGTACPGCKGNRTIACKITITPKKRQLLFMVGHPSKHWGGPKVLMKPDGLICLDCSVLLAEADEPTDKLPRPKLVPHFSASFGKVVMTLGAIIALYLLWMMVSPFF